MTPKPAAHVCGLQDRHNDPCTCTTQGTGPAHTPTPWSIDKETINDPDVVIESKSGCFVAQVSSDADDTEAQANAAFIVRAVNAHEELLDNIRQAIRALEAGLDDTGECIGHVSTMDCVVDDLKQAIAKAEGK